MESKVTLSANVYLNLPFFVWDRWFHRFSTLVPIPLAGNGLLIKRGYGSTTERAFPNDTPHAINYLS